MSIDDMVDLFIYNWNAGRVNSLGNLLREIGEGDRIEEKMKANLEKIINEVRKEKGDG